jgi:hypothetical protein
MPFCQSVLAESSVEFQVHLVSKTFLNVKVPDVSQLVDNLPEIKARATKFRFLEPTAQMHRFRKDLVYFDFS